jgi:hypothetical protein
MRNDGPGFNAIFEISSGQFSQHQVTRVAVELPTNTRKRIMVPAFATSRYGRWDFRLLDEKGNVRAEQLAKTPRKQLTWKTPVIGALSRSLNGAPVLPKIKSSQEELQPSVARLQPEFFPDNPIALEGLSAIYLDSEIAVELKAPQREALIGWLNAGGHLIVNVEQLSDLNASGWLETLLPCELVFSAKIKNGVALDDWLAVHSSNQVDESSLFLKNPKNKASKNIAPKNPFSELVPDATFDGSSPLVFTGKLRDGKIAASTDGIPLVVEATRGRGRLTLLTFNAEREPFLSWKNRPWFWVKLTDIRTELYVDSDFNSWGGTSIDGAFGAMIDSKQVRKLPISMLLLLLVVYLLVIGPLDRYWLKKLNRQMLTWITFPIYVVVFSLLIYFIGFRLRAGDSELNELQVVDVLPNQQQAVLRGRTFGSIYSPANQKYTLASEQPFATLRSEFASGFGSGNGDSTVIQRGNHFVGEISVPIWTSRLFVSDWLQLSKMPLKISAVPNGENWNVTIENQTDRALSDARVVLSNRVYSVGVLPANHVSKIQLQHAQGIELKNFAKQNGQQFFGAAQMRQRSFGAEQRDFNLPISAMAASFASQVDDDEHQFFISPAGFDLSKFASQGIILLAWDSGHALAEPLNHFKPKRIHRDTLFRLVVPNENFSN